MQKTIAIVEDDIEQRNFFVNALGRRGFRAEGAGTVKEALRLLEELGETTDVMLLDMQLLDPDDPSTGAEIAIKLRDKHPDWMPEYVVKTAYSYIVDYYRFAIELGVAAYLSHDKVTEEDVIRHIRALALKRALRVDRPQVMAALSAISQSTRNLSQAVVTFCRDMLASELDACLGTPYVLLLSDEYGTQNVATNYNLPNGYQSFYAAIQEMAHSINTPSSPYVISDVEIKGFPTPTTATDVIILERLPGAAFLPLAKVMQFKLSLILFVPRSGEWKLAEETGPFASVLAQHVRPSIFEHFLGMLIQLDAQNRMMLTSASRFCLYIGQEQERIIGDGLKSAELQRETNLYHSLSTMAEDLRRTGTILDSATSGHAREALAVIEMKDMVEKELSDLMATTDFGNLNFFVAGSCQVNAGSDLAIAVKRLLQWLIQRSTETPPAMEPEIQVQCIACEHDSKIIFRDRSRRLPTGLREQLFEPFSTSVLRTSGEGESGPGLYLPLYLAKVLVEAKYGGRLSDESDAMEGDIGHMLMMSFKPPPRGQRVDKPALNQ